MGAGQGGLVRVYPGSPELGLWLQLSAGLGLPQPGLAVPGGGTLLYPSSNLLLPTATLSLPTAVPNVPASPVGVRAVAPSSATTAGSPGTLTAPVHRCHQSPAWPPPQHSWPNRRSWPMVRPWPRMGAAGLGFGTVVCLCASCLRGCWSQDPEFPLTASAAVS